MEKKLYKKRKKNNEVRGYGALTVVGFIFLLVFSLSLFIPTVWSFLTSLKSASEWGDSKLALPKYLAIENYIVAFLKTGYTVRPPFYEQGYNINMVGMTFNGIVYALGCTVANTATAAVVAYGCARFKSAVGSFLHTTVLLAMIIPIVGSAASEMQFVRWLGFYNNMLGMFVMKMNYLGTDFLIFYAAFKGISKDYSDAASIDGAGNFTIMIKIIFPLVSATFSTMMLLAFIGYWNDYSIPLKYIPDLPNLALGLYKFKNSTDNGTVEAPMQLAGCFIMFLPILTIFIAFRNKFMLNVSIGGLKG